MVRLGASEARKLLTIELLVKPQYDYSAQESLVVTSSILIQTVNEQCYTSLICRLGSDVILAMAGSKREDSVTQDWAQFDLLRNSQCELTGRISTVKPATEMLCVMMN